MRASTKRKRQVEYTCLERPRLQLRKPELYVYMSECTLNSYTKPSTTYYLPVYKRPSQNTVRVVQGFREPIPGSILAASSHPRLHLQSPCA